ncbi:MAG: hypothetical protein WC788_07325 [Candidatus Paceibacterota bacterium]|jgi:hypothetical protein
MFRKKYYKETKKCTIHKGGYGRSLAKIMEMFREAKSDFPELKEEDVEVIDIVGPTDGRLIGIRFDVKKEKVPISYERHSG